MNDPDSSFLESYLPPNSSPEASPEFEGELLQRVHHHRRMKQTYRNSGIAFVVLTVALGIQVFQNPPAQLQRGFQRRQAAQAGVDWLLDQQREDGSWNVVAQGGHGSFSVGTSALALSALLHAPEGVSRDNMEQAGDFLQQALAQQTNGSSPLLYNELMAMHSLLELQARYPNNERADFLRERVAGLIQLQQADGGWGYQAGGSLNYGPVADNPSNSAVTWWVCRILEQAERVQPSGRRTRSLEAGQAWLARCFPEEGPIRYTPNGSESDADEALYWMALLGQPGRLESEALSSSGNRHDAYRDWIRSRSIQNDGMTRDLLAQQDQDGSWQANEDRWKRAGGRIYATAARVISLSPPEA